MGLYQGLVSTHKVSIERPALVVCSEFVARRTVGGRPSYPHGAVGQHLHLEVPLPTGDGVGLLQAIGAVLHPLPPLLFIAAWGMTGTH